MATKPKMIDRRHKALGGQSNDRSRSAIKVIVWHYTATNEGSIESHENYWKNHHGWDRGGYHFYIDRKGNIYQNYNVERMTWGVANNNGHTVHVSLEAASKKDYNAAQIKAREQVTRWLMADLKISASNVKGHWEVYNNTSCPGYTKAEMDNFRSGLAKAVSKPVVKPNLTSGASYKETGTFYPNTTIIVRDRPTTAGNIIARYYNGEHVDYHTVHKVAGYVWLQYTRANGAQGYIPCREYANGNIGPVWGKIK